ncbi:integrase [Thermocatellispora tengchongensis]|uniref:Integrase n=1 Tax=Thermocatellispora tengchongensis TaxID=1073253 RepID=A0A840PJ70_9ACTN|nr:hypothetical protein [Thermocatellispora tengchongensis]MBB5137610.1 integrase [Thermocatellispora tengchongensis]
MAYAERRGDKIRVRWKQANGKYNGGVTYNEETGEDFTTLEEAKAYGELQEKRIQLGLRRDRERIKFGEWAWTWYTGLELEPSTMATYRSMLQGHLLPEWADTWLDDMKDTDFDPWERGIVRAGYAPRTAQDARRLMGNILGDAIPRYLDRNPAARKRGKGKKGIRRIQAYQRATKVWPSPGEVLVIAERAALLAGDPDLLLAAITKAWTGLRWSELMALSPDQVLADDALLDINRKLYELRGFYIGWPKDGSVRQIDLPAFLVPLLKELAGRARKCTCRGRDEDLPPVDGGEEVTWCPGARYLFLTPERTHYGRGEASAIMRPAADGVYPERKDKRWPRPARPVLADVAVYGPRPARGRPEVVAANAWPGVPVHVPWPYAVADEPFVPPRGRGRPDYAAWPDREQPHLVTWLPIRPGLTWHGLRHGHQTWMDDAGLRKAFKTHRMGHEDSTMSGRYGHITAGMQRAFQEASETWWESAIAERFQLWPTSQIPILDAELARWRDGTASQVVTAIGPRNRARSRSA